MALSNSTVWEFRSTATAANANGGGFVTGASGTDFSQQDAAQFNLTTATSAGAGDVVLDAASDASMIGNIANVISGTNFTVGRYHIIAATPGVSFQVDRAITTGVGSLGVINIGGALLEINDAILETAPTGGGNIFYVKGGATYTTPAAISISASGGASLPNKIIGYTGSRATATGAARPTIDVDGNNFTLGTNWEVYNCIFTTTTANGISVGTSGKIINCKSTNSSGSAGRNAVTAQSTNVLLFNNEMISTNGRGITMNGASVSGSIVGNYIHDSDIGINDTTTTLSSFYAYNIVETCATKAIFLGAAKTGQVRFLNNTLYGAATPTGIGLDITTGSTNISAYNNIFSGFVTGINHADANQTISTGDYNNFNNNTTNATNWTLGANDITSSPAFVDAPNGNFAVGTNVQKVGFPGAFPGALSTGYVDIGAVQSDKAGFFSDVTGANVLTTFGAYKYNSLSNNRTPTVVQPATSDVRSGTTYGPSSGLTGTLVATPPPVRKTSDATSKMVQKTSSAS